MALRHKIRHWFRSARTGRFVTPRFARRHQATTVHETEPLPRLRSASIDAAAASERLREAMRSSESRRVDPH